MKNLIFAIVIVIMLLFIVFAVADYTKVSPSSFPDVPDSPFSAIYVFEQQTEYGQRTMTTNIVPRIYGDTIRISNYWWREYDEEDNTEWLRRAEDYYSIYFSTADGVITVRDIKDTQFIKIVEMYRGQ